MPAIIRSDWSGAWTPNVDLVNGKANQFPRFDNLVLDVRGVASLRGGSAIIFRSGTVADGGGEIDCHSLFTCLMGNSVFRCAGIDGSVYVNGARRQQNVDGSGDIKFANGQGFVYWSRGTTHSKYDGSTVVNWGIAKPTAPPSISAIEPDTTVIADFGESGENWQGYTGSLEHADGQDEVAGGAIRITPSEDANQAVALYVFAAENDYTVYDGGQVGVDSDLVELFVGHDTPRQLVSITLDIDCNGDGKPFETDYFSYVFFPDFAVDQILDPKKTKAPTLPDNVLITKFNQDAADDSLESYKQRYRNRSKTNAAGNPEDETVAPLTWSRMSVPRGAFDRIGGTADKGWETLAAVRITCNVQKMDATNPDETYGTLLFDDLRISGGAERTLTGKFRCAYRLFNQTTNYRAHSPLSDFSAEIELKINGLSVSVPAAARAQFDSQSDGIEIFLIGGSTNEIYRFYESTNPQAPAHTIVKSELTSVLENIKATRDGNTPPPNIRSIVTDHFFRTLVLTEEGDLWCSERLDQDLFRSARIINASRTASMLWMVKSGNEVICGLTSDICRLAGKGDEYPDGTIDFSLEPMGVQFPPTSEAVALDENLLIYIASDGPRQLGAAGSSVALRDQCDLLYEGQSRYGVEALDLGLGPGRIRMGIFRGMLFMLAPEGSNHNSSTVIHVRHLPFAKWYRFVYPFSIRAVLREPNGLLTAGVTDGVHQGTVVQLQTGNMDADLTSGQVDGSIPVELWTVLDSDGTPLIHKEGFDFRADLNTGGVQATVGFYKDDTISPVTVGLLTASPLNPDGVLQQSIAINDLTDFKRVQLRINGTFTTFRIAEYALTYRPRPLARLYWDTGFLDTRGSEVTWFRTITIKLMSYVNVTVTPFFDGVEFQSFLIAVQPGVVFPYRIPIPKGYSGYQPRFVIQTSIAGTDLEKSGLEETAKFELYQIKFELRDTGQATQNRKLSFSFTDPGNQ